MCETSNLSGINSNSPYFFLKVLKSKGLRFSDCDWHGWLVDFALEPVGFCFSISQHSTMEILTIWMPRLGASVYLFKDYGAEICWMDSIRFQSSHLFWKYRLRYWSWGSRRGWWCDSYTFGSYIASNPIASVYSNAFALSSWTQWWLSHCPFYGSILWVNGVTARSTCWPQFSIIQVSCLKLYTIQGIDVNQGWVAYFIFCKLRVGMEIAIFQVFVV